MFYDTIAITGGKFSKAEIHAVCSLFMQTKPQPFVDHVMQPSPIHLENIHKHGHN